MTNLFPNMKNRYLPTCIPKESEWKTTFKATAGFCEFLVMCRKHSKIQSILLTDKVRISASRGGIGTMRAASAPFFRHSATATAPIVVAVFPCVTEKRERNRVPRIAGIGAAYSWCRL